MKKEMIIKGLLLISFIGILIIVIIPFVLIFMEGEIELILEGVMFCGILMAGIGGVLFIILAITWGGIKLKPVTAE
ncbi:MAG: hypothetical protein ACLU8F_04045 [Clostridia bacterium]